MWVVVLGNDPWSVPTVEALARSDDLELALVVTNPPRPAGRGSALTPTAVATAARSLGLPLLETPRVRDGDGFEALRAAVERGAEAFVVVAYGELLTAEVLAVPPLGCMNVHFSLLPRWRGAAPVQHAILGGDRVTGVSVMLMDRGLDTGPVLATATTEIGSDEDAGSLGSRLARIGADLLVATLPAFAAHRIDPVPQQGSEATSAPKLAPAERVLDWAAEPDAVVRRVRAFAPAPGARTAFRGRGLKVLRADAVPEIGSVLAPPPLRPGELVLPGDVAGETAPWVAAGAGAVRLLEVAPEGRARMGGADWANGARIERGERLS